ncbi:hypothetical protein T484DRAFT_1820440, partial [Baffinella frigidus]
DSLEAALSQDAPDYDWLVRLFSEVRDRLCAMTPSRSSIHAEIHAGLDADLFAQM